MKKTAGGGGEFPQNSKKGNKEGEGFKADLCYFRLRGVERKKGWLFGTKNIYGKNFSSQSHWGPKI